MPQELAQALGPVAGQFAFEGQLIFAEPYGDSPAHDSYAVYFRREAARPVRYLLQRLGPEGTPAPYMEGVARVAAQVAEQVRLAGANLEREALLLVPTREGAPFWQGEDRAVWRAWQFIEDAFSPGGPAAAGEHAADREQLYQAGLLYGRFLRHTAGFPAGSLSAVLPPSLPQRFAAMEQALQAAEPERRAGAAEPLALAMARKGQADALDTLFGPGELPVRVTHGAPGLAHVLLDRATGRGLCVCNLDSLRPGPAPVEFGQAVCREAVDWLPQGGCLDGQRFTAYTAGYLSQTRGTLTRRELEALPFGVLLAAFGQGVAALAAYLSGGSPEELARACRRLALLADLEQRIGEMRGVIRRYL